MMKFSVRVQNFSGKAGLAAIGSFMRFETTRLQ